MKTTQAVDFIVAPPAFNQVIDEWLTDMQVNGRGVRTIGEHRQYIARLDRWLTTQQIPWYQMSRHDMQAFMRTVANKGVSLRTNLGTTMRVFWDYAVLFEYVSSSPAVVVKTPKKLRAVPRALSRPQIRRLLDYLKTKEGRSARRNECMIITGLYTAARASEITALRWDDIDIVSEAVTIRNGKTGGRTVALHPELADVLTRWRDLQAKGLRVHGDLPIFALDEQGTGGIKGTRLGKICKRISTDLGFTVHAHALRHSAATHALRCGAGLWNVSRMLGHADTSTTSRTYILTDPTDSAPAVKALPTLDRW